MNSTRLATRSEVSTTSKVVTSALAAVAGITTRSSIATGLSLRGTPSALLDALFMSGVKDLEIISNETGVDSKDFARLLMAGRVRRIVAPNPSGDKDFARQYLGRGIAVELIQQDVLAERLRAGGLGVAAFFTQTGVVPRAQDGARPRHDSVNAAALALHPKETRTFCGMEYVLERGIAPDFSLVHAWKGDRHGNLVYRDADRIFNHLCALSGRITIAEVEELVESGDLNPADIHTPGTLVQQVVALAPSPT